MDSYTNQQESIIIKGIAQQLLSMPSPTFEDINKLISQFKTVEKVLIKKELYTEYPKKELGGQKKINKHVLMY